MPTKNDVLSWDKEYEHVDWANGIDLSDIRSELSEKFGNNPVTDSDLDSCIISESSSCIISHPIIFDAGCGNGRYLKDLCRHFLCIGMDISSGGIRRASDSLLKMRDQLFSFPELIVGSVTNIPFGDNSFDAVVSFGVFQHLSQNDRRVAASEIFRILKCGGLFFFESFGSDDMRRGGEALLDDYGVPEENTYVRNSGIIYHYFPEEEVKKLFTDAGFEIKKLTHIRREKRFNGEVHVRHHIRCIMERPVDSKRILSEFLFQNPKKSLSWNQLRLFVLFFLISCDFYDMHFFRIFP